MKKTIILFMAALAFGSCKKSDTTPAVNSEDLLSNIIEAHQSKVETFTIDAAAGGVITGEKGTKITFPPGAFADAANTIASGKVIVKLRESLTKDQWIADGLSTITADNQLLQSGGMIQVIAADANGKALRINEKLQRPGNLDSVVKAEVPKPPTPPNVDMSLWQPTSDNSTVWTPANYYPFGGGPNSYLFQLPGFTWVNCDGLNGDPRPKTTVRVVPDFTEIAGATDVQVFFVYHNISTCITLPPSTGYWESYQNSIPEGSMADVVILGKAASGRVIFKVLPDVQFSTLQQISIAPVLSTGAAVSTYLSNIQ